MSDLTGKTPIERHLDTGDRKMITEMWAWVCEETPGSEGVIAVIGRGGLVEPCVGADRDRIEDYRHVAIATRISTARPVRLVRLTRREVVETLK